MNRFPYDEDLKRHLRAVCAAEDPKACRRLVEEKPESREDFDVASGELERLCTRARHEEKKAKGDPGPAHDLTCACGSFGIVLTWSAYFKRGDRDHEAILLLDEACVRGYLDACDMASLMAEVCVHEWSAGCDDLLFEGRIPTPRDDEGARNVALWVPLRGCFVEPSGTIICFEDDRISTKALDGSWDQIAVSWRGYAGIGVFWPSHAHLRLELDGSGAKYGREQLARAPEAVRREARALPNVNDVCARARRCAHPPRDLDESERDPSPSTLKECLALERAACRSKAP
jgi:hypothetical protein